MANCKIEQEDDKDLYKDKILHSLKVKPVAMLEALTNHVWIEEVFDLKGVLLKISIDYTLSPCMEHDSLDFLLGRRMRKASAFPQEPQALAKETFASWKCCEEHSGSKLGDGLCQFVLHLHCFFTSW